MCYKETTSTDHECTNKETCYATVEEDYIENRLIPQICYYSKSSRRLQKEYYIISVINTVIMAAVPVIAMLSDTVNHIKYVISATSALASVLSSVLLVRRTKDNWIEYRATSEMLKSELAAFKAKAVEYRLDDANQRFTLLVDRCEKIMQVERTGWYSRMQQESDQVYGVKGTSEETSS